MTSMSMLPFLAAFHRYAISTLSSLNDIIFDGCVVADVCYISVDIVDMRNLFTEDLH